MGRSAPPIPRPACLHKTCRRRAKRDDSPPAVRRCKSSCRIMKHPLDNMGHTWVRLQSIGIPPTQRAHWNPSKLEAGSKKTRGYKLTNFYTGFTLSYYLERSREWPLSNPQKTLLFWQQHKNGRKGWVACSDKKRSFTIPKIWYFLIISDLPSKRCLHKAIA